jgi:hypothetical protein
MSDQNGFRDWPDSSEFWRDKRVIVTGGSGLGYVGLRRTVEWYEQTLLRQEKREEAI